MTEERLQEIEETTGDTPLLAELIAEIRHSWQGLRYWRDAYGRLQAREQRLCQELTVARATSRHRQEVECLAMEVAAKQVPLRPGDGDG